MLRSLARKTLTEFAAHLPVNTRRSMMEALAKGSEGYGLFQAIGRRYGVCDIGVAGDYGLIEGSLSDDAIIAGYARDKHWAFETNRAFSAFFETRRRGTYIDVGANLGLTTIPIAQFRDVACKAFEPEPDNFRHLARNVAAHCRHGNVALFNIALYDRKGMIDFEIDPHNHGDHRIHVHDRKGLLTELSRPVIAVQSERLDDILNPERLERPIAVKMDTQGSEAQIIAGGPRLLKESELVFLEFWPYSMARFDADIDALVGFIEENFPSGSIVPGDHDAAPDWQPISSVVAKMRERWQLAEAEPFVYHEIYLRK